MLGDERHVFRRERLGDDGHAGALPHLAEYFQSLLAQPLEAVGRGARLVGAAAHDLDAHAGQPVGDLQGLRAALHRAGAGHERQIAPADGGVAHADHRVVGMRRARCEAVGRLQRQDLVHTRHRAEQVGLEHALAGQEADYHALCGAGDLGRAAQIANAVGQGRDLAGGGAGFHDDNHRRVSSEELGRRARRNSLPAALRGRVSMNSTAAGVL